MTICEELEQLDDHLTELIKLCKPYEHKKKEVKSDILLNQLTNSKENK